MEPFGRVCVGVSDVTSMMMPDEYLVIGAPAATAPAVAGTAVPLFSVSPPVRLIETPVAARPSTMFPVPVTLSEMVPDPFASTVRFSSVPELITAIATPPAAAAPVTLMPVATEPVEAST